MKPVRRLLPILFLCGSAVVLPQNSKPAASAPTSLAGVVDAYCVTCHNARLKEGKLVLGGPTAQHVMDPQRPWTDADVWERVLRQLRARTMPPADNPRPDPQVYESLVEGLAAALDRGDPHQKAAPAKPRASDTEIATHLAAFLWSGAPDAALAGIARKGLLHDPSILQAQVRRMLADPRIAGFVQGFFDEWLGLNPLESMPADAAAFPQFDAALRNAMLRETELFMQSQLSEDRPATEMWTANYTFLNARLAQHYGAGNVAGSQFRRVALPGNDRAGLLGQASILTATSVLTRHPAVDAPSTSPAARAKWIRTHYLGVFAPHPLATIPPLQKGVLLSAQLRTLPDPSCNACHSNFFPMGYALENFDPLGRWRTEADGETIDVSGSLSDGAGFNGPAELRRLLLERQDAFLTTITERLLAYAIGDKTGISQPAPAERMPAVRAILRNAEPHGNTWSALLAGIAGSAVFQAR